MGSSQPSMQEACGWGGLACCFLSTATASAAAAAPAVARLSPPLRALCCSAATLRTLLR